MLAKPTSRRLVIAGAVPAAVLALGSRGADAEEAFSRMGGLLEPFIDVKKGYKLYKPSNWNQFDTDPGVYDVKFQDIIEPFETVQVSSSPVTTATSISSLGDLQAVGAKISKSRNAELVSASQRDSDGSLVYIIELEGDTYHELLALCINRNKLYRVSTVASNKRWPKRAELYRNVIASFVPRGY